MDTPLTLAANIVILIFSIVVHEVMHGLAALRFGDHTAEKAGRLTLNPIPHIDPVGSILLPALFLISQTFGGGSGVILGWAKPVPVNPYNFNKPRIAELVVSIAGVAANFAIAIILAVIFRLIYSGTVSDLTGILANGVMINLALALFNLLPIPPLDGSKVVMFFLPPHLEAQYRRLEQYGFLILAIFLFTPIGSVLFGFLGILRVFLLRNLLGV